MDIKKLNYLFENGMLPQEFNYDISKPEIVDWSKVQYNTFYKSHEYHIGKFPYGFENLPSADRIIENIILNAKSPLEEISARQESIFSIEDINESSVSPPPNAR